MCLLKLLIGLSMTTSEMYLTFNHTCGCGVEQRGDGMSIGYLGPTSNRHSVSVLHDEPRLIFTRRSDNVLLTSLGYTDNQTIIPIMRAAERVPVTSKEAYAL